jgi:hypothetical protein
MIRTYFFNSAKRVFDIGSISSPGVCYVYLQVMITEARVGRRFTYITVLNNQYIGRPGILYSAHIH